MLQTWLLPLDRQVSQTGTVIRWQTPKTELRIQQHKLLGHGHYVPHTQTGLNPVACSPAGAGCQGPGCPTACLARDSAPTQARNSGVISSCFWMGLLAAMLMCQTVEQEAPTPTRHPRHLAETEFLTSQLSGI